MLLTKEVEHICKSGIYKIVNLVNNKIYIGSAFNLQQRKLEHFKRLKKNKHENKYLQNSFNKYNEYNFIFEVIEFIEDKDKLLEREQHWIDKSNACNRKIGYNICLIAGNTKGFKHSDETKRKISDFNKGNKNALGTKWTEEQRRKLSESRKGIIPTKETVRKIQETRKWYKPTEETKQKMRNKVISEETRQKLSKIRKGAILSEETKQKISNSRKGKNSKLTINDVVKIKQMLKENIEQKDIAKQFNVKQNTISYINTGKTWNHIRIEDFL